MIDLLLVRRLVKLYSIGEAGEEFKLKARDLRGVAPIAEFLPEDKRVTVPRSWHIGRVRHFYDLIKAGQAPDPITVDNVCYENYISPAPVVLDGHHRLVASVLAKALTIPAHYSGRVDVLDYLMGKRLRVPEY